MGRIIIKEFLHCAFFHLYYVIDIPNVYCYVVCLIAFIKTLLWVLESEPD